MCRTPPDPRFPGNGAAPARLQAAARRLAREMERAGWAGAASDVETAFELDEHGRVWMIREGDCHIVGRREAVCAEMARFLGAVVGEGPS